MPDVRITEFTDAGCPWAFSAEPFRLRLDWLYGEHLEWPTRMVGLSESPQDYLDKGFTTEKQSSAFMTIAKDHGMPIDTSLRPRMAATVPACRAVVAARLHAPDRERALLRRLRVRHFSGELLDEPATIAGAAADAGLDLGGLEGWMGRGGGRGRAARGHGGEPRAHARRPCARRQAGQLVRRAALHLPVV
jgi:predicted DsbA family dithiol-disulfide isomerase